MVITIVSKYRGSDGEHFVGAFRGELTDEQKSEITNHFLQQIGISDKGEDVDEIGFAVVNVYECPLDGYSDQRQIPFEMLKEWTRDGYATGDLSDAVND